MKKIVLFFLISCFLFINCASGKKESFTNLDVKIEEADDELLKVTVSGFKVSSALSIKNYQVEYDDNKVFVEIKESLGDTGMVMNYYIQFLMRKSVNEIYLGGELLWTNSVESYFKNQKLKFPLDINTTINKNAKININNDPAEAELSKEELKKINDFANYLSKNLTFESCKKWKKDAVAFSLSTFGIYEDGGKKYLCVSVNAYSEKSKVYDMEKKIGNMDISVLHNILLFDYETYEELGWMF